MQDVIELQSHGERFSLQESLCQLRIPDQFVGVECLIAVASSALVMDIRGEAHAPGCIEVQRGTVGELPGIEISRCLQQIARVAIVHRSVSRYFKPILTHTQLQPFIHAA